MGEAGLLASVRVLDLSAGDADAVGRILADLGADVCKIETPGGSPARRAAPTVAGASIGFALDNANKRCARLDPADDGTGAGSSSSLPPRTSSSTAETLVALRLSGHHAPSWPTGTLTW